MQVQTANLALVFTPLLLVLTLVPLCEELADLQDSLLPADNFIDSLNVLAPNSSHVDILKAPLFRRLFERQCNTFAFHHPGHQITLDIRVVVRNVVLEVDVVVDRVVGFPGNVGNLQVEIPLSRFG